MSLNSIYLKLLERLIDVHTKQIDQPWKAQYAYTKGKSVDAVSTVMWKVKKALENY